MLCVCGIWGRCHSASSLILNIKTKYHETCICNRDVATATRNRLPSRKIKFITYKQNKS